MIFLSPKPSLPFFSQGALCRIKMTKTTERSIDLNIPMLTVFLFLFHESKAWSSHRVCMESFEYSASMIGSSLQVHARWHCLASLMQSRRIEYICRGATRFESVCILPLSALLFKWLISCQLPRRYWQGPPSIGIIDFLIGVRLVTCRFIDQSTHCTVYS